MSFLIFTSYAKNCIPPLLSPGATIADALAIGYRSILVDDASRGVDLTDIERTKRSILDHHGVIVDSHQARHQPVAVLSNIYTPWPVGVLFKAGIFTVS